MPRKLHSEDYATIYIATYLTVRLSTYAYIFKSLQTSRPLRGHLLTKILATSSNDTPESSEYGGHSSSSLKQLASQLIQWRGMLPAELQWNEDDPAGFPTATPINLRNYDEPLDPNLSPNSRQSNPPMFTSDLDSEPSQYPYVYDIQVALLRTRYYYAKYKAYRPFVYKALHFPEQMTQEDAEGVAECLRVCT